MLEEEQALKLDIKNAENLHGHLGPFLVIGVKMARLAKKTLKLNGEQQKELQVMAKLPLAPPFSCVLDGIQAATQCTVGNGKLKIKNCKKSITATFKLKNQNKALKIQVNPEVIKTLMQKFAKKVPNEELAWKIAATMEAELFKIKSR